MLEIMPEWLEADGTEPQTTVPFLSSDPELHALMLYFQKGVNTHECTFHSTVQLRSHQWH